ncbi:MAG TPA: glycine zipper domain-containing protein [Caulobacteraceae bacterium]|nr:glycine zipper domain-containing protein [Caulobacteraceae bacterium]
MRRLMLSAGLVVAMAAATGAPQAASAEGYHDYHRREYHHVDHRRYYHHRYHRYAGCMAGKRRSGTIGAVTGGVGGALIGHAVVGGLGGALLGAGAGALAGNAIGRHVHHC